MAIIDAEMIRSLPRLGHDNSVGDDTAIAGYARVEHVKKVREFWIA